MFHLASMPAAHGEHIYYGEAISGNTASFFSKFFFEKRLCAFKTGQSLDDQCQFTWRWCWHCTECAASHHQACNSWKRRLWGGEENSSIAAHHGPVLLSTNSMVPESNKFFSKFGCRSHIHHDSWLMQSIGLLQWFQWLTFWLFTSRNSSGVSVLSFI